MRNPRVDNVPGKDQLNYRRNEMFTMFTLKKHTHEKLNPGEETIEIPIDLEIFGHVITVDVFLGCNNVLFKKFRVIVL